MYQNLTKAEVLEWNDRNGTYNDEDSEAEGLDPITKEEAIEIIIRQFEF